MKIPFAIEVGPMPVECILDVDVEWDRGNPHIVIDGVSILGDEKHNLLLSDDVLMVEIAARIANAAEDDERLLERAVEMDLEAA